MKFPLALLEGAQAGVAVTGHCQHLPVPAQAASGSWPPGTPHNRKLPCWGCRVASGSAQHGSLASDPRPWSLKRRKLRPRLPGPTGHCGRERLLPESRAPARGPSEFSASGGTDAVTVPAQTAAGAKDKVPESTILKRTGPGKEARARYVDVQLM